MVFAAGLGLRMRPLTLDKPKPLIEVGGRTMLDRALDHLVHAGVQKVVVNTHYLAGQVEGHLRSRDDLEITILREPVLLETGGGLKNALPYLGVEPIYVINSDIVWVDGETPALSNLCLHWRPEMDVLLLLIERSRATGYDGMGDFSLGENGLLTRPDGFRPYVFGGVQIVKPGIVANNPEEIFSLNQHYFNNPRAYGVVHDGMWLHIGTPEGLKLAERRLASSLK